MNDQENETPAAVRAVRSPVSREHLFELAWSTTMAKIAAMYGVRMDRLVKVSKCPPGDISTLLCGGLTVAPLS